MGNLLIRNRRGVFAGAALVLALGVPGSAIGATAPPSDSPPPTDEDDASPGCDPLDRRHCLLPFPSDHYTVGDDSTPTGRRIALPAAGVPANADGVPIDAAEWNRNDGFSPNTTILTHVADLDAEASRLPSWTDLGASLDDDATVVLVDLDTGARVPLWAELDADSADTADGPLLVIHPAVVLTAGHRYAVALRGLVDTAGAAIAPAAPFGTDGLDPSWEEVERLATLTSVADALDGAGVDTSDLYRAWDFTVASTVNLTARMLHIRDETLAALGDSAPPFTIDEVIDEPTNDDGERREGIARTVTGTFTAINWLTGDGGPGNGFSYADGSAPDALPEPNGEVTATFQCNIPAVTLDGDEPARLIQYGHGLLGSEREINAGNQIALTNRANAVNCATKWAGMSEDDIPNAVASLEDFSNFPTLADRLQQGILNQLVLTRLLLADDGLASAPAFQFDDGTALVDNSTVAFNGNSQGAIMGLAVAGVSTDIDRFVLGVGGMNYGILLARSIDFDVYKEILDPSYPDGADRTVVIAMTQMLWDRGEGAGYVSHVTADPLPGTPTKDVLVHVAFGDHQVTELTAYIQARAMGMPVHRPIAADGRSGEVEPGWGLESLEYPSDGSGLIVWDSGSDPIPLEAVPPRTSRDPHGDPRADPAAQLQIAAFLFDGVLVDVCDAGPCTAEPT